MSRSLPFFSALTAVSLTATFASADIIAQDVWDHWQALSDTYDYDTTATVTETETGLEISDLAAIFVDHSTGMEITMTVPEIVLTNGSDGTVSYAHSSEYVVSVLFPGVSGELSVPVNVTIQQDGTSGVASGEPQFITYNFFANSLQIADLEVREMDTVFTVAAMIEDYAGNMSFDLRQPGELSGQSTAAIGAISLSGLIEELEAPVGNFEVNIDGFDVDSETRLPIIPGLMNFVAYADGAFADSRVTFESAQVQFGYSSPFETVDLAASAIDGHFFGIISDGVANLDMSESDVVVDLTVSSAPVPMSFRSDMMAFDATFPIRPLGAPTDIALDVNYENLTLGETVWSLFDPGHVVPRDPANLRADLTGSAEVFWDIFNLFAFTIDPSVPEPDFLSPFGELQQVIINEVFVSVADTELNATGQLDFEPGPFAPVPIGEIDVSLSGGNTLIGTLAEIGILPPQQAGMARGLLGMFAIPGASPDSYNSTIGFGPGGSITANGVPLQ